MRRPTIITLVTLGVATLAAVIAWAFLDNGYPVAALVVMAGAGYAVGRLHGGDA